MAPRMYPHYDSDEALKAEIKSDGATGEIAVYKLLRKTLPNNWVVLFNTHIKAFKKSQSDFYVFVPGKGIVNVDAKGYNYSYRDNSFWLKDSDSDTEKSIDIIDHADKAMANLSAYIKETILGLEPWEQWGAYASLIVFASQDIQGRENLPGGYPCIFRSDIDADPSIVKRSIEAELDAAIKAHPACEGQFTGGRMERILGHFIARRTGIMRSLDFQNNDERLQFPLTVAQNSVYYSILDHHYVHVRGGAGTGKTMIAMAVANEIARDSQKKVLYVCFNVNLAERVAREIHLTNIRVLNFHKLGNLVGRHDLCVSGPDNKLNRIASDANIHAILPQALRGRDKFDAVLIDEAQDLTADNLKCLICLAKRERHVAIFSDEFQTIFSIAPRHGAQQAWEFPKAEVFGEEEVITFDLSTNIRNTDRIFEACQQLSSERTKPGHIIEGVEVARTSETCKDIVRRLREKNNYSPSDIVVLAPRKELLPTGDDIFTDNLDLWWKNCKVLRATIQSFKGLDANCVIFLGENLCSAELKYEAMSRAKYELYIVE